MLGRSSRREGLRRAAAIAAAAAVAVVVFLLRRAGILDGIAALAFATVVVLLLPYSATLSGRVLLGGALFLGWIPALWWVRLPVPEVDRVGLVLALVTGSLVCWVLWGADTRVRLRRLVPNFALVDAMPFVAGGLALWTTWPWLTPPSGERALNAIATMAWDNVSHFSMVLSTRAGGAIVPMLGLAPDGSPWVWGDYPQHFHATVAAITDLYSGPAIGDIATEVLRYGRALVLVQVLTAALLAAGVAQLPALRRRAEFAWPLGALLVAAFIFGPGSWALSIGFPNFVLASAAAGLAVLLALPVCGAEIKPLQVFALGGLVVATVHGWLLLAPMAVAACALVLLPLRRDRWPQTKWGWAKIAAAAALTVLACAVVVPILMGAGGVEALAVENDVLPAGFVKLSYLFRTSGVALAVALAAYVRRTTPESGKKGLGLAGVSLMAFLLVGLLGGYVYAKTGSLSYYFDKLLIGVSLISVASIVAGAELHVGLPRPSLTKIRRAAAIVATLLASGAALLLFGANGIHTRAQANELTHTTSPAVERILKAAELTESLPFGSAVYVAAMPGDLNQVISHDWQMALSNTWSYGSNPAQKLPWRFTNVEKAAELAQNMLQADPQRIVIVAPEILDSIRSEVAVGLGSRVITWETP